VLTLGPILMGLSITMTAYLVSTSLGYAKGVPFLGEVVLRTAPVLLTSVAIMLLYLWVPNRRVRLAHAVAGGLVAGILFELMKRGFGLYISQFPTYTTIYGAFAAVPIFLLWLYLSWLVVLMGAVVTALIPGYYRSERRGGVAGQQFYDALALLALLARAQRNGKVRSLSRFAQDMKLAPEQCERLLDRMESAGWVAQGAGDGWVLAREASSLCAADVYRLFVLGEQARDDALAPLVQEHQSDVARRMQVRLNELYPEEKK
jgi:membrane protein